MSNKGALALLCDYGGDSSDEEVPGSRASTKRLHKDDEEEFANKRFERLPVPNFSLNDPEKVTDDPSLHEGRKRSFPHERGNWATYVYIPYSMNEGISRFISLLTNALIEENIELKCFEELHISLTRTVTLKHHWIDPFINSLKENLQHFNKFIAMLDRLEVYCNEEKTRTFIGLQIKTGYDSLLRLVHCFDQCLGEFKLPKFYENPSFHVSIGWCLEDRSDKLKSLLGKLNQDLEELMNELPQDYWYIYVEHIMCKTGNKLFQFELK